MDRRVLWGRSTNGGMMLIFRCYKRATKVGFLQVELTGHENPFLAAEMDPKSVSSHLLFTGARPSLFRRIHMIAHSWRMFLSTILSIVTNWIDLWMVAALNPSQKIERYHQDRKCCMFQATVYLSAASHSTPSILFSWAGNPSFFLFLWRENWEQASSVAWGHKSFLVHDCFLSLVYN